MSNGTFLAFTNEWCYRESFDFQGYITWFLYTTPITLWYMIWGLAWYSRDTYIQVLSSTYWITSIMNVFLQEVVQQQHPNPDCNNQGYGMPSWEIQMCFHFIVIMVVHRLYFIRALDINDLLRGLGLAILIPGWLIFSGNYTWAQAAIGATVGIGTGLFCAQWVFLFWMDRFPVLATHPIIQKLGYRHNIPLFYLKKDMEEEKRTSLTDPFLSEVKKEDINRAAWYKYPIRIGKDTRRVHLKNVLYNNRTQDEEAPIQTELYEPPASTTQPTTYPWQSSRLANLIGSAMLGDDVIWEQKE